MIICRLSYEISFLEIINLSSLIFIHTLIHFCHLKDVSNANGAEVINPLKDTSDDTADGSGGNQTNKLLKGLTFIDSPLVFSGKLLFNKFIILNPKPLI